MANGETPDAASPPYIPFSTFTNFVERLKNTAVPEKIDNSLLTHLAGGLRGSVRSTLRFLGLTDANDTVNTTFHDLIQAHGTESWKPALAAVIDSAYVPILNGLDLTRATPAQLTSKFKAIGTSGQMMAKSIRFLLAAMESASKPFSPHLKLRATPAAPKGPKRPPKGKAAEQGNDEDDETETDENTFTPPPGVKVRSFSFPVPGEPDIRVVVPEGLDDLDVWQMVSATLQSYIALNKKAKSRKASAGGET